MSQHQQIIKYIVKNCPVGELGQLFHDLKVVYPDFEPEAYEPEIKKYFEDHMVILQNEGNDFLISQSLQQDTGYLDPTHSTQVLVDFIEQAILESQPLETQDSPLLDLQREIYNTLSTYKKEYLNKENSIVTVKVSGSIDNPDILICLASKYYNFKYFFYLRNYCGGEWNSEWRVSNLTLTGDVKINTHYFEEGNVQLKKEKHFECKLEADNLSQQILKYIGSSDESLCTQLETFYVNLSENVFKTVRRVMPITNCKMDWSLQTHKLLANLKQI